MSSSQPNEDSATYPDDPSDEESNRNMLELKMDSLFRTLEPFIHKLDQHVIAVRTSQELLNQELNSMLTLLHQIQNLDSSVAPTSRSVSSLSIHSVPDSEVASVSSIPRGRISADISVDLEDKSRRLLGLKRRLTLVHSILSTVNSRVKKLLLAHNSRLAGSTSLDQYRSTS